MKNLNLFFLVIAVLVMVACGKKTDPAKVIELQKELTEQWDKAMNAGDADALAGFYTNDAIRMTPNEPAWEGKEAIRKGYRTLLEINSVNCTDKVSDVILTGDYAIVRGTGKYDIIPKAGSPTVHGEGKWLDIRKLQPDGSWKVISSIWNSDLPPVVNNQ